MLRAIACLVLAAVAGFAADDDWGKVKALKTGAEIRVYKKGTVQPVLALMDELTDENLIVVVKKSQMAIPREQIDRIDARPAQTGGRLKSETTNKETFPDAKSARPSGGRGSDVPGNNTATNVTVNSKPDFETVYRRPTGAPKK
jgi:hypothetical protein